MVCYLLGMRVMKSRNVCMLSGQVNWENNNIWKEWEEWNTLNWIFREVWWKMNKRFILFQDTNHYQNLVTTVMNIPFERRSNVLVWCATDNLLNTDSDLWVVVVDNIVIIIFIIIPRYFNFMFSSYVVPYVLPTLYMPVCLSDYVTLQNHDCPSGWESDKRSATLSLLMSR